ncbi:MAG: 2OG-Fe(II) oxygenase [Bacteriovoracaceae bacterium]|nr:2OG-Fe(II) oxygenase [Bacteriovoracaceae bacterium]
MNSSDLISNLIEFGWHTEDNFLTTTHCHELIKDQKHWKSAAIGTGAKKALHQEIRNDEIAWISAEEASKAQKKFLLLMDLLQVHLNRELYLGLKEFECHFAKYEKGGFYKKHLDQHQGSKNRILSCIVYLNKLNNGGELVIYNKNNIESVDKIIQPKPGKLVCFLSDQIFHEVLPTDEERLSLTGWFRANSSLIL